MIAEALVGPRDSIRLDTFRAATGVALIGFMADWWMDDAAEWLTVAGFHLSPAAAGPGWLSPPPLPLWALAPFGVAFFGVMVAFTLGYRLPWSAGALLLFMVYVSHVDPLASYTPNNLFLATLAMLTVASHGPYWTIGDPPPRPVSVWPVRLLQATLVVFYFTAGTCKAFRGDWLSNSHVLYWTAHGPYQTAAGTWLLAHVPAHAWTLLQSVSLSFELLAPVLFLVRRLRPLGYVLGAGMHAAIGLTLSEFAWFGVQMVSFYVLFMDEDRLHRLRARLASLGGRQLTPA